MNKSKRSPSRIKYEQSHPTISARLSLETRDKLILNLETAGISLADAFKVLAGELELKVKPLEQARKDGFDEARKLYMVTYPCDICGKPTPLTSPKAKEAASQFMTELGWGHTKCHEQKRLS